MENDDDEFETPRPFTLEEAQAWLGKVEDDAWLAQASAGGVEFILGNVLLHLAHKGLIDAKPFLSALRAMAPLLEMPARQGAENMLDELLKRLDAPRDGGSGGYMLH